MGSAFGQMWWMQFCCHIAPETTLLSPTLEVTTHLKKYENVHLLKKDQMFDLGSGLDKVFFESFKPLL